MILLIPTEAYINCLIIYNAPPLDSVNFSLSRETSSLMKNIKEIMSACTDDGRIISWDASDIRSISETEYRRRFRLVAPTADIHRATPSSTRPNTAGDIFGDGDFPPDEVRDYYFVCLVYFLYLFRMK
jgi:hypothetical protein